jgi:phosphopantothenoylcysteine synthetase/decarboxylase
MKIGRSGGVRDLTDSGYYIRDDGTVLLRHTVYRSETPVEDELITVASVPREATVTITSPATASATATATAP